MKIKISKSQWEEAGKKAGWMKVAQALVPDPDLYNEKQELEQEQKDLKEHIAFVRRYLVSLNKKVAQGNWKQAIEHAHNVLEELESIHYIVQPNDSLEVDERY